MTGNNEIRPQRNLWIVCCTGSNKLKVICEEKRERWTDFYLHTTQNVMFCGGIRMIPKLTVAQDFYLRILIEMKTNTDQSLILNEINIKSGESLNYLCLI